MRKKKDPKFKDLSTKRIKFLEENPTFEDKEPVYKVDFTPKQKPIPKYRYYFHLAGLKKPSKPS